MRSICPSSICQSYSVEILKRTERVKLHSTRNISSVMPVTQYAGEDTFTNKVTISPLIRMQHFSRTESNILRFVAGEPAEREAHLLSPAPGEEKDTDRYVRVDHDLVGVGCEVELPSTVLTEKHCLDSSCRIFIQSGLALKGGKKTART